MNKNEKLLELWLKQIFLEKEKKYEEIVKQGQNIKNIDVKIIKIIERKVNEDPDILLNNI